MKKNLLSIMLLPFMVATSRADWVKTKENWNLYGHIERMDKTELVLTAQYQKWQGGVETVTHSIRRSEIVEIEFNDRKINSGLPPPLGSRPPSESNATPSSTDYDYAELFGDPRYVCKEATIEIRNGLQFLVCGGKRPRSTSSVIRLHLARH